MSPPIACRLDGHCFLHNNNRFCGSVFRARRPANAFAAAPAVGGRGAGTGKKQREKDGATTKAFASYPPTCAKKYGVLSCCSGTRNRRVRTVRTVLSFDVGSRCTTSIETPPTRPTKTRHDHFVDGSTRRCPHREQRLRLERCAQHWASGDLLPGGTKTKLNRGTPTTGEKYTDHPGASS